MHRNSQYIKHIHIHTQGGRNSHLYHHLLPFFFERSNTVRRLELEGIKYGRIVLWRQGLSSSHHSHFHPFPPLCNWSQRTLFPGCRMKLPAKGYPRTKRPCCITDAHHAYHVHVLQWWEFPLTMDKTWEMVHNTKYCARKKEVLPWDSVASWGYLALPLQIRLLGKTLTFLGHSGLT